VAKAEKTRTSIGAGVGDAADRVDGSSIESLQWKTNVWFAGDSGYKTAEGPCPRSVLTPASQPLVLVNLKDL